MRDKNNLAVVLHGIGDLRLEQRPVPDPADNQVLLKMATIGICGSDVHYYTEGKIGPFVVEKPMIIGHEASGTVVKLGRNVKHLQIGDRVAIEPGVGCRMCDFCKTGNYHLCLDMRFCATPPIDGNLSRYYVHDADFCFKLPDNVSLEEGTLMEPLAVGVHACKRANVRFGDKVLVLGSGPIGLASMLAAKAMGASKVFITDLLDYRLKKAKELGADYILNTKKLTSHDAIVEVVTKALGGSPEVSIDCVGAEECVKIAMQATKSGGSIVIVGLKEFEMTLPVSSTLTREVDIKGSFRYVNDYPTAIEMVRTGKVKIKPLITHHFDIEDAVKAFETAKKGAGNPIKILIHANPVDENQQENGNQQQPPVCYMPYCYPMPCQPFHYHC